MLTPPKPKHLVLAKRMTPPPFDPENDDREEYIEEAQYVDVNFWTSTKKTHRWLAKNAIKFGYFSVASEPRACAMDDEDVANIPVPSYGYNHHRLQISPLYDADEVIKYLLEGATAAEQN